jgi:hypothetical protein
MKGKQNDSPAWKDLLRIKQFYLAGRKMLVVGGGETDFWHDAWCGDFSLYEKFYNLYEICNQKDCTVKALAQTNWDLTFRRWLDPALQILWRELRDDLSRVALSPGRDKPIWKYTKSGKFTVKSLYNRLSSVGIDRFFKHLWKAKIPLKIKICLWLIWHNAIATKDNMKKRKWVGNYACSFCSSDESINHLFFACPAAKYMWSIVATSIGAPNRPICFTQYFWWIADRLPGRTNLHVICVAALCWVIWKTWNKACFDGKTLSNPVELICYTCVFLRYWAGLQNEGEKGILNEGAARLQQVAIQAQELCRKIKRKRLRDDNDKNEDDGGSDD